MKTIFFRDHQKFDDFAHDLYSLLQELKGEKGVRILFDPTTYELSPLYCCERNLCISNHGWNGPKRIGALVEGMEDVELDFSGSTILSNGVVTPFAVLCSKNVTIKNVILENHKTCFMQATVVGHGDGYVDVNPTHGREQFVLRRDGELAIPYNECIFTLYTNIEFNGETGEIEHGTGDQTLGASVEKLRYEDRENGILRIHGVKRYPPVGNVLVFNAARRLGTGFFCEDSTNIVCENVTIHSCYGMGILAQTCENITLRSFHTLRHDDWLYTANADATHFVNCTGVVTVEDSTFEGQLDDALNIHGIYTRILKKAETDLYVNEVHSQAKGIRIYQVGDRIQVLKPDILIPYTEKTITEVEYINADMIRLSVAEGTADVDIGDDVESLTRCADLIFRNNTVRNNRARGMLIATRGKTVIEDCYFHTGGSAVLFESDGALWFESGGVWDVTIRNNVFDNCKHSSWGKAVVQCVPRKAVVGGKYFHREIRVLDNQFSMVSDCVAILDNVEHAVFRGNQITAAEGVTPYLVVHHVGTPEIESELPVKVQEN